jgi:hypothetical protein
MLNAPIEGFPLSPQQRRLWSLSRGDERHHPYRALCQVLIQGQLDGERLRRAVDDTVRAHEILRTAFLPFAGLIFPLQAVADFPAAWSEDRDLSGLGQRERQAALDELFEDLGSGPVDLTGGPLLRLALARLEPERHALLAGLPALCADAAGLASLLRAIGRRYAAPGLTDEPLQYADLAAWQNELLESAEPGRSAPALPSPSSCPPHQRPPFGRGPWRCGWSPRSPRTWPRWPGWTARRSRACCSPPGGPCSGD